MEDPWWNRKLRLHQESHSQSAAVSSLQTAGLDQYMKDVYDLLLAIIAE